MKMWIARDLNDGLYLYRNLPRLDYDTYAFDSDSDEWWELDSDLFTEVTFENSPMEVELVIKK